MGAEHCLKSTQKVAVVLTPVYHPLQKLARTSTYDKEACTSSIPSADPGILQAGGDRAIASHERGILVDSHTLCIATFQVSAYTGTMTM